MNHLARDRGRKNLRVARAPLSLGDDPRANVIWNDWIMASIAGLCVRCELRNLRPSSFFTFSR